MLEYEVTFSLTGGSGQSQKINVILTEYPNSNAGWRPFEVAVERLVGKKPIVFNAKLIGKK